MAQSHTGVLSFDQYQEFDTGAVGQRTYMADVSGATTWTYDIHGRPTRETKVVAGSGGGTFVTQWGGYNSAGQLGWMQYPGGNGGEIGEQVDYGYNDHGALDSVAGSATYVQNIAYDVAGRITQLVRGDGTLTTDYDYYPWNTQGGRLEKLRTSNTLQNFRYAYDAVGNILTIEDWTDTTWIPFVWIEVPQTQSFVYDELHRLTSVEAVYGDNGTYPQETYAYDSDGRLASKAGVSYTYGDTAHVHAVTSAGSNSYTYDANGNMEQRNTSAGNFTLTHDAENRLTGVSGAASASFVYDGDGSVKGTVNGATTVYIGNYPCVLIIVRQRNPIFRQDVSHAAVHWFYISCAYSSGGACGGFSANTAFNWIGSMESGRRRYNDFDPNTIIPNNGAWNLADEVVQNILRPPNEEWKRTEGNQWNDEWDPVNLHPYTWGNLSMFTRPPPNFIHIIPGKNPWYLLTLFQANNAERK